MLCVLGFTLVSDFVFVFYGEFWLILEVCFDCFVMLVGKRLVYFAFGGGWRELVCG